MFDFDDDGSKLTEAGGKRKYEALLKKKSKSLENLETKLEQRVIMRFDPSLVENIPDNILIVPWFPQVTSNMQHATCHM